jgi:hypothetical protein
MRSEGWMQERGLLLGDSLASFIVKISVIEIIILQLNKLSVEEGKKEKNKK